MTIMQKLTTLVPSSQAPSAPDTPLGPPYRLVQKHLEFAAYREGRDRPTWYRSKSGEPWMARGLNWWVR
jgi:hypothetical protein